MLDRPRLGTRKIYDLIKLLPHYLPDIGSDSKARGLGRSALASAQLLLYRFLVTIIR